MTNQEKEKYQENLKLIRATLDGTQFDYGWLAKFFLLFGIASLLEIALTKVAVSLPFVDLNLALICKDIFGALKVLVVVVGYILIRYKIVATQSAHTLQLYRLWGFGIFTPWLLNVFFHIVKNLFDDFCKFTNTSEIVALCLIELCGCFFFLAVFLCTSLITSNRNMLIGAIYTTFIVFAVVLWIVFWQANRNASPAGITYEFAVFVYLTNNLATFELLKSAICIAIGATFCVKSRKAYERI